MEKGDTGRKEATGGKTGHGLEQTAPTQKKKKHFQSRERWLPHRNLLRFVLLT